MDTTGQQRDTRLMRVYSPITDKAPVHVTDSDLGEHWLGYFTGSYDNGQTRETVTLRFVNEMSVHAFNQTLLGFIADFPEMVKEAEEHAARMRQMLVDNDIHLEFEDIADDEDDDDTEEVLSTLADNVIPFNKSGRVH